MLPTADEARSGRGKAARPEQQSWLPSLSVPGNALPSGTLPRPAALALSGLRSKGPAELYSTATLTPPDDYVLPAYSATTRQQQVKDGTDAGMHCCG